MKTPITPQGLPPLPQGTEFHSMDKDPASDGFMPFKVSPLKTWFTADQMQAYAEAYAREALAAQAASVVPVGEVMEGAQTVGFGRKEIQKFAQFDQSLPVGTKLYTGAPPSPASVPAAAVDAVPYATWQEVDRFFSGRLAELGSLSGEATDLHAYVRAALQASHQPQPQQAVAEGAGDGLRQTLIDVGRVIAWQCFGDCRAYDEFGPGSLRGLHEMDAEIRAALATKEPK